MQYRTKKTSIFFIVLPIFSSCYFKLTQHLSGSNPTEYVYSSPIKTVREAIEKNFDSSRYKGMWYDKGDIGGADNKNSFWLNSFWSYAEKSAIYYNWWGHLRMATAYHIILDSISGTQTKVTIESSPRVETGIMVDYNHGLPCGLIANEVPVKPSTVEEYQILKLIGDSLGQKNMPEIIRPQGLL